METKLENFLEQLQRVTSREALQDVIIGLRDLYDLRNVVYHSRSAAGGHSVALTYSQDWIDRYVEKNYIRIDPVVRGSQERFHPVDWKQLDWSKKSLRDFHGESLDAGVGNQGFSVPIRGPGGQFALFSISQNCSDDEWATYTRSNIRDLILIAHYLNHKALDLGDASMPDTQIALAPREIDVLTLLALGYSRGQAAESLSISEHTLRVYIDTARFKLGAANTIHAVAKALTRGLIVV